MSSLNSPTFFLSPHLSVYGQNWNQVNWELEWLLAARCVKREVIPRRSWKAFRVLTAINSVNRRLRAREKHHQRILRLQLGGKRRRILARPARLRFDRATSVLQRLLGEIPRQLKVTRVEHLHGARLRASPFLHPRQQPGGNKRPDHHAKHPRNHAASTKRLGKRQLAPWHLETIDKVKGVGEPRHRRRDATSPKPKQN